MDFWVQQNRSSMEIGGIGGGGGVVLDGRKGSLGMGGKFGSEVDDQRE
jgi:hypothetical protein